MRYLKTFENFSDRFSKQEDLWNMIPQSIKDIHQLFKEAGKKIYLVGGSVRDFLTGDKPKDFDVCTDALPDEILEIIGDKYKTNLQGAAFGVVVVYTKDQPDGIEIATFRQDTSKGRNPEVKLGVGIEQDVLRRDISYNAMFYDLDTKKIVDLVGGVKDLEAGITRMVGNPEERFDEDSLRILRSFRFASRYGHPLDKQTEEAIKDRAKLYNGKRLVNLNPKNDTIEPISQERIWEEFKKAFSQAKDFRTYLNFIHKFDLWNEVFPGSVINNENIVTKDLICVLANLFIDEDTSKLEKKMVQSWRIETDLARKVIFLIDLTKLSPENAPDLCRQRDRSAISDESILEWLKIQTLSDEMFTVFMDFKPKVDSQDLMSRGFKGKQLGDEIKRLEVEQFKSQI